MEPVIELRNITKRFDLRQESSSLWRFFMNKPSLDEVSSDTYKLVLDNISISIKQGERVALIGRNGAGKSTLLKIISRILTPDQGTVTVNGTISSLLELGVGFHPELTGEDNIYFYGALMGKNRSQVSAVYNDICEFADIGNYIEQPVKTYSSGMYQRLAFSCAFAMQPNILIADEGLSVGDFLFQQKCFDRIEQIVATGTTFLMVAHSARQVQRIATRGIWLENGRIMMDGDINEVQDEYTQFLLRERDLVTNTQSDAPPVVTPDSTESGDNVQVVVVKPIVDVLEFVLDGDTMHWRNSHPSMAFARLFVHVPELRTHIRVRITDVADDLPLIQNNYHRMIPVDLVQGEQIIKVQIPPLHLKRGTYRLDLEIFESDCVTVLAKSIPVTLQSRRKHIEVDAAYLQNPRIKVHLTDETMPAPLSEKVD